MYTGTALTLIADISLSNVNALDVPLSLDISWSREDDIISNDTRITVSPSSGSGASYAATLTYSPIENDDSGLVRVTVSVRPSNESQFIQNVTTTFTQEMLYVEGICTCFTISHTLTIFYRPT